MVTHEPSTSDAASATFETARTDAEGHDDSTAPQGLDAVFTALRHPRRRYVVSVLAHRDGEQSLTRLATELVAWETDQPRDAVGADARDRCRTALHHVHLPKLTALDIVEYDPDGEPTVRAGDTDAAQTLVDGVGDELDAAPTAPLDHDGA